MSTSRTYVSCYVQTTTISKSLQTLKLQYGTVGRQWVVAATPLYFLSLQYIPLSIASLCTLSIVHIFKFKVPTLTEMNHGIFYH